MIPGPATPALSSIQATVLYVTARDLSMQMNMNEGEKEN